MWEGQALIAELRAPAGANWAAVGDKGYRYRDRTRANDGLELVAVLAGPAGRPKQTKVSVVGKGVNLPDPAVPVPTLVNMTVQVIDSEAGICFGQTFTGVHLRRNGANAAGTVRTFKAVFRTFRFPLP
ncbi:MAG: hypothetical protein KatS3mg076_1946 [Candidatus Binatia bacterium]|nr:MAG: hypothetical protein KatS3mg076_1946 [Candidatus Binatia bacterium]